MAHHNAQYTPSLPDLLDQLPVDVVGRNVWQQIPLPTRGSLRQCSKQCLQLANLLSTHVTLTEACDEEDLDASSELEAWHQAVEQRSAFLARLPRLDSLHLVHWPGEAALTALLTRYGAAAKGRLTRLTLQGAAVCIHTTSTLRSTCPRLAELGLYFEDRGEEEEEAAWWGGDLLLPLKDLPLITLDVRSDSEVSVDVLRSLSGLSRLQRLDLRLGNIFPRQLKPLATLLHLQHLCVGRPEYCEENRRYLLDVTALLTLTRLTHLELRHIHHKHAATPADAAANADAGDLAAFAAAAAAACADVTAMQAAVAPLAHLRNLRTLIFSPHFVIDDVLFQPLRQLSQLTRLDAAGLHLTRPLPGALPALQHLQLHSRLRPSKLLQTLLPLLPLPSLRWLGARDFGSAKPPQLEISVCCCPGDAADAATQAAALKAAAQHLAAAPHLAMALSSLEVCLKHPGWDVLPLDVVAGLSPLGGRLESLALACLPHMGAEWAVLCGCLPRLQHLAFLNCELLDATLAVLAARASLRTLLVVECRGLTVEGWVGLAVVRDSALLVKVNPALPPADVQRCQAVQTRLFGRQNLMFM